MQRQPNRSGAAPRDADGPGPAPSEAAAGPLEKAAWHVYIVRCADQTLYTGVTNDLPARLSQHNAGRGAKYTRTRLPVILVYREEASARGDALRREHQIKRMRLSEKRELIVTGATTGRRPIR